MCLFHSVVSFILQELTAGIKKPAVKLALGITQE